MAGLKPGDKVRVGQGRTVWEIQAFWRRQTNGPQLATLHNGWNSTTVESARLVKVEAD